MSQDESALPNRFIEHAYRSSVGLSGESPHPLSEQDHGCMLRLLWRLLPLTPLRVRRLGRNQVRSIGRRQFMADAGGLGYDEPAVHSFEMNETVVDLDAMCKIDSRD